VIGLSALFALALLQDAQDQPVTLHDNGFCAGVSWVTLQPGETVTADRGPDFLVFRVKGRADRWWGVYGGMAGQASPDRAHPLLGKDGATVYRGTEAEEGRKRFGGYFVARGGGQNHFFGNVFKDAATDRAFFARVRFGRVAEQLCTAARAKGGR
jgi:hypothetical protein